MNPKYSHLVLAIPHAVGRPSLVDWTNNAAAVADSRRWTDWYADELFTVGRPRVSVVPGCVSRLDCDLERLEGEAGRLCRFADHYGPDASAAVPGEKRNRWLAEWYRYRWGILAAAAEGGFPLILDCHSFPADLAPEVEICLGFNGDGTYPGDELMEVAWRHFRSAGYRVALNDPYANAIAPEGYCGHSLMIEVSKECYLEAATLTKSAGFVRLHETLARFYDLLL